MWQSVGGATELSSVRPLVSRMQLPITGYPMFGKYSKALANEPRLLNLLLSLCFLLFALASKSYTGPFHRFANHYLGDLFIVGWLYFLLLLVFPKLSPSLTAAVVLTISVFVEIAQAKLITKFPGVPSWILFWTGTTFDPLDLLVYLAGVSLAVSTDLFLIRGK